MDHNKNTKYSKYFEYYHKQKILFSSRKDKYKKCEGCLQEKVFKEINNILTLNCGDLNSQGDCGDQFEIILPEYKYYYTETERLNKIIHGSFDHEKDVKNIKNYDLEKLDKYIDVSEELKTKNEIIEQASGELKNINNKYIKENKLKENIGKIQELYNIKKKQNETLIKIMKKINDPLITDDKKSILRKEYAKTIYDNQRAIYELITELNEPTKDYIKIKDEEINIMNELDAEGKKDKKEKKDKKDKKGKE